MKKTVLLISLITFMMLNGFSQTTVNLTLDASGEDVTIDDYYPANNTPNGIDYAPGSWTISNTPTIWRSFFKFDLSSIPSNAVIQSASLSLYYATVNSYGNALHSSFSHSDESVLQLVTSPWTENTMTWNNQPSSSSQYQVIIPQSTSGTQNYLNINVNSLIQQMIMPTMNFGFLIKLTDENPYARMLFASGDNADVSKHPHLSITYVLADTCVTLKVNSNNEDVTIDDYYPANNTPNGIDYAPASWTISNTPTIWRSFFKFDLSSIPANAVIQSASVSLYYASVNSYGNAFHSSLSHSNESVLQRVTSPWTENTMTWNNQPSSSSQDQAILAQTTSGTQNYLNINVTNMLLQMLTPSTNYGFLIKLMDETPYARLLFASGDNPDANKHPELTICYSIAAGVHQIKEDNLFVTYPNPSSGNFTLMLKNEEGNAHLEIINTLGQTMHEENLQISKGSPQKNIELDNTIHGLHILRVIMNDKTYESKLLIK